MLSFNGLCFGMYNADRNWMTEITLMSGKHEQNSFFIAALLASLLLHLTLLWLGRDFTVGDTTASSETFSDVMSVAFASASLPRPMHSRKTESKRRIDSRPVPKPEPLPPAKVADVGDTSELAERPEDDGENAEVDQANPSDEQGGGSQKAFEVRDHYLAQVLAHIESHKYYPPSARRRGVEGSVEVRFMLDAYGGITRLDVTGRSALLEEAARTAIQNAMPLPPAPSTDGFPLLVSYQMLFKLQR